MAAVEILRRVTFLLSEHPAIVNFRWSHTQSWGSTWTFLFSAILIYLSLSLLLHLSMRFLHLRSIPISLGPIPALLNLTLALLSAAIFAGTLLSAAAEIRDTRWLWSSPRRRFGGGGGGAWRSNHLTPLQWLLCFPLGTRPSGRVFFWSYLYYLSRFLHMLRTFLATIRRRRASLFHLLNHSILTFMSFLWLEFSMSFQVLAILSATLAYAAVHGYRFWTAVAAGPPPGRARFPFVINCQIALLACHVACHVGVLTLHLLKGGCNGIGAWGLNSVLNGVILLLFLNFYVKNKRTFSGKLRDINNNKDM